MAWDRALNDKTLALLSLQMAVPDDSDNPSYTIVVEFINASNGVMQQLPGQQRRPGAVDSLNKVVRRSTCVISASA